jgi:hypothetical protein
MKRKRRQQERFFSQVLNRIPAAGKTVDIGVIDIKHEKIPTVQIWAH